MKVPAISGGIQVTSRSFDDRLERIQWVPGAVPSQEVIDSVLGGRRGLAKARSVGATLMGAISGICIGFGIKGMTLVGSPWGARYRYGGHYRGQPVSVWPVCISDPGDLCCAAQS